MRIGILGGGIAGLSAAYFLSKHTSNFDIYEAAPFTGGLARSFNWHGFDCDIGPHRFYTTDPELLDEITNLVDMNKVRRNTAIFVKGKWISDPVNAVEVVLKFFPQPSINIVWTYLFKKKRPEDNFENMVLNQFGTGLNSFFFKPYSEKLFGIPISGISPEWGRAKLRVSGLRDLIQRKSKLYFRDYWYPKNGGYGTTGDKMEEQISGNIHRSTKVIGIERIGQTYRCNFSSEGRTFTEDYDHIISTLPINVFAEMLGKNVDLSFQESSIHYFLLDKSQMTPNQWFYVADKEYSINRVAEFKNFQGENQPNDKTVIGVEVTRPGVSTDDVVQELVGMNLVSPSEILDTKVIHLPKVYPVYSIGYEEKIEDLKSFFGGHPNITLVGRHGTFNHVDIDDIIIEARNKVKEIDL